MKKMALSFILALTCGHAFALRSSAAVDSCKVRSAQAFLVVNSVQSFYDGSCEVKASVNSEVPNSWNESTTCWLDADVLRDMPLSLDRCALEAGDTLSGVVVLQNLTSGKKRLTLE
jgi:hypothetical protein